MMNHITEADSSLEFFKIFLPDSGSHHMVIPPAFVKHLKGTFPKKSTIRDHLGKSWFLTLKKLDDLVCFKNGWKDFVDYHLLSYGDFLIFQYDGDSTFDVKIFGKNGCKKAVVEEATYFVPVVETVVEEAAYSVPIVETMVEEVAYSFPTEEAVIAEDAYSVPIVEAVVAEAAYSVPIEEAVIAEDAYSVPIEEAVIAEDAYPVPNLEIVVAEAAYSVPIEEAVIAEDPYSVSIVEDVVSEAAYSVRIVEAVAAEACSTVSIVKAADAVVGNYVPILEVKEEPVFEIEDVNPSISSKRKRLQVGSQIVLYKRRSIAAQNCGSPPNPSNSVEPVDQRVFFERIMKRWSNKTIYIPGCMVRDHKILLKPNIVLRDEDGNLWPSTVSSTSQNRISLTVGWSTFYNVHKLRLNDRCEFEFVLEKGNVCQQLNVKITRC